MIRCKIIETTRADADAGSRTARAVESDALSFGRAAASKIYLPDPRVRLNHASIERGEDGYLYVEGLGGPVLVDASAVQRVRVGEEQRIDVGPYAFTVTSVTHGPQVPQALVTLEVSHRAAGNAADSAHAERMARNRPLLSIRLWSWLLCLSIGVYLLAVPAWQAYHPVRSAAADVVSPPPAMDALWNPGTISSAHQGFGDDCKLCHTKPFVRVKDSACTACHMQVGPHVRAHGVAQVALQQEAFGGQRCASCHRDHQGVDGMKKIDAIGCVQCHGSIRAHAQTTTLPDIPSLAKHPEFRLSLRSSDAPKEAVRIERTPQLQERSGLKFPHEIHLAAKGIKSPDGPTATGGRVVLECISCHHLDSAQVRYQPVTMGRDCIQCHRIGFDIQGKERQLPHAAPATVVAQLEDMYSALALEQFPAQVVTVNSLLLAPQTKPASTASATAAQWVQERTVAAATVLLDDPKGLCQTCHAVESSAEPAVAPGGVRTWKVRTVVSNNHWLPESKFSHAQHSTAKCASCHAATVSKTSDDILIPPVAVCRDCHADPRAGAVRIDGTKVVSTCEACHSFHSPVMHASLAKTPLTPAP